MAVKLISVHQRLGPRLSSATCLAKYLKGLWVHTRTRYNFLLNFDGKQLLVPGEYAPYSCQVAEGSGVLMASMAVVIFLYGREGGYFDSVGFTGVGHPTRRGLGNRWMQGRMAKTKI